MLGKIVGALGQVAEAGGTIVGIRSGTEEPDFTVERKIGNVEIRRYGPRIAAETPIAADEEAARNEGFRRLARYIFGGNQSKTKIAMTAPVAQQPSEKIAMTAPVASQRGPGGEWVIRFFMPSKYTLDSLPTPNEDVVRLVEVPGETVAVLRYRFDQRRVHRVAHQGVAGHPSRQWHRAGRRPVLLVLPRPGRFRSCAATRPRS